MTLYPVTTAQAAELLRCTPRTVQRHVAAHGLGRELGRLVVLSEDDVAKLRNLVQPGPGHPKRPEKQTRKNLRKNSKRG